MGSILGYPSFWEITMCHSILGFYPKAPNEFWGLAQGFEVRGLGLKLQSFGCRILESMVLVEGLGTRLRVWA